MNTLLHKSVRSLLHGFPFAFSRQRVEGAQYMWVENYLYFDIFRVTLVGRMAGKGLTWLDRGTNFI